jgi:hypothetical protein
LLRNEGRNALVTKWRTLKAFEQELETKQKIDEMKSNKRGIKHIDDSLMKEKLTAEEIRLVGEYEELRTIIRHINHVVQYKLE